MELRLDALSDEGLVAASREGDRAAYAALVRRHSKRVYALALGILGNAADSEDAVQEAFVRGMMSIRSIREDDRFAGWISQIARNLCRDRLRSRRRERDLPDRMPADPATVRGDFRELHLALERLPEKHRLPLMLYYFDGKSTEKLASELRITRAGAITRLFRARAELRKLLGGEARL